MDKLGFIEIRITGSKGNLDLTPDNYDISEVISILENAENLLYSSDKKDRPTISYKIEEGSVRHILKTSIQTIIGFNAILGQVKANSNIDFLDFPTATSLENIQNIATKRNYQFSIKTSLSDTNELTINSKTKFYRIESIWADAELYLYGKVTNAGGKDKANIHIYTEQRGSLRIQTPISFLEEYDENILYRNFGVRAIGKQHLETGEIDTSNLKFVELIDYHPKYDPEYLKGLRDKAKKSWLGKINPDNWLNELRGNYDT